MNTEDPYHSTCDTRKIFSWSKHKAKVHILYLFVGNDYVLIWVKYSPTEAIPHIVQSIPPFADNHADINSTSPSGGSRNFKTGGRGLGAVEFLGSEFCLMPPFTHILCFIVRVENKVHIVNIVWWICVLYSQNLQIQPHPPKKIQTGGRAPGAPVLDPPLSPGIRVVNYKMTKVHIKTNIKINHSYRLHCLTEVDRYLPRWL